MGMHHRVDLGPRTQDVAMKTPFRRRPDLLEHRRVIGHVKRQPDDVLRLQLRIGDAAWCDQQTILPPRTDVARGSLVYPETLHLEGGLNHLPAQRSLSVRHAIHNAPPPDANRVAKFLSKGCPTIPRSVMKPVTRS